MNLKPRIKKLKNGLRVVTCSLPQMRSLTALLMIKVGSRRENNKQAGISHFLEHLPAKGTKKYPTAHKLAAVIDAVGAEHNAFTSKEYTGFYVKSSIKHLDLSLDILHQLIFHPLLPKQEIEKERGVIIEEINMYEDYPMARAGWEFEDLIFPNSSLGRQTIGSKKTVQALTRQDFINYRQQWYNPKQMVLGLAGGIKTGEISAPLHESLGKFKPASIKPLKFKQKQPQVKLKYKKTEQTHLCLGVRGFPESHPDRYVMAVLATILGGNMSSRLFSEVREKRGLAYYIRSSLDSYSDNGCLVSQAGVDINKVEEAIKVILDVHQSIIKKVHGQELKRAKEYLKGKLALSLEDSKEIAGLLVEDLLMEDKIRTPDQIIRGIEKVSLGDLRRVVKKIFVNKGLNLALIGPYRDEQRFRKMLRF